MFKTNVIFFKSGNTDHWTYKLPDTKPLDQFRGMCLEYYRHI